MREMRSWNEPVCETASTSIKKSQALENQLNRQKPSIGAVIVANGGHQLRVQPPNTPSHP